MRHLQDEQLLLLIDGELKPRAASAARSHLETCWQCRVELQEIQDTVGECVRYRKNILHSHLPPPPAPWNDIYRQFNEIDASMEPAFFQRFTRLLGWPLQSVARWAPVAIALLVLAVILYQYRQTPSVHAAELLRKAIAAADTRTVHPRAILIRTRDHSYNRRSVSSAEAAELNSLHAKFVAAKYDWEDPLSAKSYQNWRDSLTTKRDQVFEDPNAYRIRTETTSGDLMTATLTLSNKDLKPIQGRLEFRNSDWVEITELPDETTLPAETTAALAPASGNFAEPTPTVTPAGIPTTDADAGDELHAMAALHSIGADLGDPVQVSLSGGKVLVGGAGIIAERQQQIQDILGANPKVVVRFADSPAVKTQLQRAPADRSSSGADAQQLQTRIAAQVGGRASFEQLASQVLDSSELMMTRAYALRRLAEQFPADSESQLSATDRQLLRRLRDDHSTALRQQVAGIERLLRPALGSAEAPAGSTPSSTEDLFQSARRVDKLMSVVFGSAPGETNVDQLPAQLMSSLAQLRARVEAFNRTEK